MNQEIEVKFLNINHAAMEKKLVSIGATKVGDYFYKRIVFDFPDLSLHKKGAFVRLRHEGDRITLTWKQRQGVKSHDGKTSDNGMEEIETVVGDFEKTANILYRLGMVSKFYEENRRSRWKKGDTVFDIDTWPMLEPYLEIEAPSWAAVDAAIAELGLDPAHKKIFTTLQVYALAGIAELDYEKITFEEQVKRKQ